METNEQTNNLEIKVKDNNRQLREFLKPSVPVTLTQELLLRQSSSVVETILEKNAVESYKEIQTELNGLYNGLKHIFDFAEVPVSIRKRQFLNKTGLAMSPQDAITTIKDVYRISGFMKCIDQAIEDLQHIFPEPLHIVYPACGPLAPLLMPLLAYYKNTGKYTEDEVQVTLIDVQEGAIMSLKKLFELAGLDVYLKGLVYGDAVDYAKKPNEKIHMVVLEAMQHGFSKEGQLAIAIHFAQLIEEKGIFLPEKIIIKAVLANGQREFNDQWEEHKYVQAALMNEEFLNERIKLGTILEVSLETIKNFDILTVDEYTRLIRCTSLKIPDIEKDRDKKIILFCSRLEIYGEETLDEYDSGITHPLPDLSICINFEPRDSKPEDLLVASGDTLEFYYRLNGLPGFLVTKQ